MKRRIVFNISTIIVVAAMLFALFAPIETALADGVVKPSEEWFASSDFLNFSAMREEIDKIKEQSGGKKVTIAVVDTGILSEHEVFEGIELVKPYNVINDSQDVTDDTKPSDYVSDSRKYHGTHVTGTVARLVKEFGLESYVSIMPIKAGDYKATFAWDKAIKAIKYAADNGANVINLSFTNELKDKPNATYVAKLNDAIDYAFQKGAVCVCAAGNQGRTNVNSFYPAACERAIGVMAYGSDNKRYSKSNYNSEFTVIAPGAEIVSSVKDGWQAKSGTSMASPIVSFIAGVVYLKTQSAEDVYTAFKEFPSDYINSGAYTLRKVDLKKLLDFKPASKLTITAVGEDGAEIEKGAKLDYFALPKITLTAQLFGLSADGNYVPTDGDVKVEWGVSDGTEDKTYSGKTLVLSDLNAKNYNVTATVTLTSGVLTSSFGFDLTVEYVKVVQKGTGLAEIVQTLGNTSELTFEAYYGVTDENGAVVEKKIEQDLEWKFSRKSDNSASLSVGKELTIPAQKKVGEFEVYANLKSENGVAEDAFTATFIVEYQKIENENIKEASGTKRSVKYAGDEIVCAVGDYRFADPNAYVVTWYVNGELITTAKSGELRYLPSGSGKFEIVGYVNDVAITKEIITILPTDKTATWILVAAAVAIIASAVGIVVLLPKYKKQEKERIE